MASRTEKLANLFATATADAVAACSDNLAAAIVYHRPCNLTRGDHRRTVAIAHTAGGRGFFEIAAYHAYVFVRPGKGIPQAIADAVTRATTALAEYLELQAQGGDVWRDVGVLENLPEGEEDLVSFVRELASIEMQVDASAAS